MYRTDKRRFSVNQAAELEYPVNLLHTLPRIQYVLQHGLDNDPVKTTIGEGQIVSVADHLHAGAK